ncbi:MULTISPECIES: RNA deprotection pyrophosphohydrolase [Anoxybacillus]|uniref:Nucleoside triphosphatase YtkD n=1 Tax=Anoxybacillus kestanbolensis TaxID=227476 RepID=A0A1V3FLI9_9BACL|nr:MULTISPECIES: nucleoside triphosphatase YtkD [Anoxybacillus]MCL9971256.1 nucleoside triphosphatase YtkD [Anoxybacillus kestanbolensis]NNU90577.1 nucleoside triphosphatase YtkD [Anoxybacillus sp. CHMUD]OOE02559.1 nucleoside triphosphatase YtkD [Anoxybacillus kestanbolensis]
MIVFQDYYGYNVRLSFSDHPFSQQPKHVFVICRYGGRWLLTNHAVRGLEFPGGKIEKGETPKQAAIREVKEETGGVVEKITYIGQYEVNRPNETIVKNIYFAHVKSLEQRESYFETNGPVLIEHMPDEIAKDERFSFIMKDGVWTYTKQELQRRGML